MKKPALNKVRMGVVCLQANSTGSSRVVGDG
jgi:hypothetical protein